MSARAVDSKLGKLLDKLSERCWEAGNFDGGELQELLSEVGFLTETRVTERCSRWCNCAEGGSFPTYCYRRNYTTDEAKP